MEGKLSRSGRVILAAVLFVAVVILANYSLQGMRLDLTEGKLYTLSDNTRNLLGNIDEPINLYLYFSEQASRSLPQYRNYYQRIREILEEFRSASGGAINLFFIDPEPFSEDEDRAASFGLLKLPLGTGESIYFGIVATDAVSGVEVMEVLDPSREAFFEYELSKLIYTLTVSDKPTVGMMSSLPIFDELIQSPLPAQNPPGSLSLVSIDQINQLFDVRKLATNIHHVDPQLDVLVVIHPQDLSPRTLYAIDQYIMNGGKAVFFVDSFAEVDQLDPVVRQTVTNPIEALSLQGSDLNFLFNAWGFNVPNTAVLADMSNALLVNRGSVSPEPLLFLAGYRRPNMDNNDPISVGIEVVNVAFASEVLPYGESTGEVTITPLLWSSTDSEMMEVEQVALMSSPSFLKKSFQSDDRKHTLVARIRGVFPSAFSEYPFPDDLESDEDADANNTAAARSGHIAKAKISGNLVVVADVDLLSDNLWVQKQNFFGQQILRPFASNMQFIVNIIDNLTGSNDLIGMRSRASFSRPFTLVNEIERKANRKYRKVEESLRQDLAETERRLSELQEDRADSESVILSGRQQTEIAKIKQEVLRTRKKLRDVNHQLVKDIDDLGSMLKVVNIGLVPFLVIFFALLFAWFRRRSLVGRQSDKPKNTK